jgi:predicted PurR-regulated permease PerM
LAVGVLLGLIGLLIWGFGWVLSKLSAVLLPLALAAIIAYLLSPVVDFCERKKFSRTSSVVMVFLFGFLLVVGLLATVVPRLVVETQQLIHRIPDYTQKGQTEVAEWLSKSPWPERVSEFFRSSSTSTNAMNATNATNTVISTNEITASETNQPPAATATTPPLQTEIGQKVVSWLTRIMPEIGNWVLAQLQRVASWLGLFLGLLLVPVYAFYLLREKRDIERGWKDYLPIRESKAKEEAIFIISSINDSLIVFFRGQVLVALCTGTLLTISFFILGLNYALLLGVMAGLLGIIPYLGVAISLIPAVTLAAVQFGDWLHPILVLVIFGVVNLLEGFVISPKIIGDRVGMHPLTIIIAVIIGTTLMGGILGGVLAIPLTAALRAMMYRYVWKKRKA